MIEFAIRTLDVVIGFCVVLGVLAAGQLIKESSQWGRK